MKNFFHFRSGCFIMFTIWITFITKAQTPYFPELILQGQTISFSNNGLLPDVYYGSDKLTSTGNNGAPLTISQDAHIQFKASKEITLTNGFTAGNFNTSYSSSTPNGEFHALIDKPLELVVISPDNVPGQGDFVHVPKWEKLELGIILPQAYQDAVNNFFNHYLSNNVNASFDLNPYASDSLDIEFTLTKPDGIQVIKYGFFMREAEWGPDQNQFGSYKAGTGVLLEANNNLSPYQWRLRFAPDQDDVGVPWSISVRISAPFTSSIPGNINPLIMTIFQFICDPPLPDNYGYLKLNPNQNNYLQFEKNAKPFFGIGENIPDKRHGAWPYGSNYALSLNFFKRDYDQIMNAFDDLASVGANYVRMLLLNESFSPEYSHLGVYDSYTTVMSCDDPSINCCYAGRVGNNQFASWAFDQVLNKAKQDHIYLNINLFPNIPIGGFEGSIWGDEAYIRNFVIPFSTRPFDFKPFYFDLSTDCDGNTSGHKAMYYWKRKLRYIISRWGYSTNIAMLEPFGELDNTLSYYQNIDYRNICNSIVDPTDPWDLNYLKDPDLRTAIENWYDCAISYLKNPAIPGNSNASYGGLGHTNHMLSAAYGAFGIFDPNTPTNQKSNYFSLFSKPYIDITDIHLYDFGINDGIYFNRVRFDIRNDFVKSVLNQPYKPFTCGEVGSFQSISVNGNNISTAEFYKNYDITFHNEIWATAFNGSYSTGLNWFWQITHRLQDANQNPSSYLPLPQDQGVPNDLNETFDIKDANQVIIEANLKIISLYHHFKRLSEFISQPGGISFDNIFQPYRSDREADGLEAYYLSNINQNEAYGWIHNMNFYWAHKYYYDQNNFDWNGCTNPTIGSGLIIHGLNPTAFYVPSFFYTRMGPAPLNFPNPQTQYQADANGDVLIPASVISYLGCDTTNADFAFSLVQVGQRPGNEKVEGQIKKNNNFSFSIFPNPNSGVFSISISGIMDQTIQFKLVITDLTGRILYRKENIGSIYTNVNLSLLSRGCYDIYVERNSVRKHQKLIIQ